MAWRELGALRWPADNSIDWITAARMTSRSASDPEHVAKGGYVPSLTSRLHRPRCCRRRCACTTGAARRGRLSQQLPTPRQRELSGRAIGATARRANQPASGWKLPAIKTAPAALREGDCPRPSFWHRTALLIPFCPTCAAQAVESALFCIGNHPSEHPRLSKLRLPTVSLGA